MKLLVVEDDLLIRQGIVMAMHHEGYLCDAACSLKETESLLQVTEYSLVMLDLGLPDGDGLQFLARLRRMKQDMPVIILTARDTLSDRVSGLDSGADDYLVKPFALEELTARVRALIRRHHKQSSNVLEVDELSIDIARRKAYCRQQLLELTPKEYAILLRLMLKVDKPVNRDVLFNDIYNWKNEPVTNSLEVHIHNLRNKIGRQRIRTVRGFGYELLSQAGQG